MDTARRWQVVSLVTAVASLSGGALLIGHQTTETLPPIDLEITTAGRQADDLGQRVVRDPRTVPVVDEIVTPPIIESHRDTTVAPDVRPSSPAPSPQPAPAPDTDPVDSDPDSAGSPDSVDSATDIDSE